MNTRKKAVALRYNEHLSAPKIAATGKGYIADTIIKKASHHHIPIIEDASLVELLAELELNESIPEELYEAVAEVFAFIYQLDRESENSEKRE